tara:strand:+ start:608 stop:1636 length:1029 start_codon:yes stop_codon:yes gene_type:complete
MSDLLKEAIADAKAVRETALENAKMALEEAFTPQLKSMLSAKLKEDEFGDEEEPEETYEDDEVGEEEPEETYEDEVEEFGHDKEDGEPEPEEGSYHEDEDEDEEEPETEEGLDLEAIIRELESELSEGEDDDEDEVEESTETSEESVSEGEHEDEDDDDKVEESEEPVEEEYEIDEAALEEEEELDEVDKSSDIGKGDNNRGNTDTSSGIGKGGKLKEVQSELKEYKEAVSFLKDKLHEVNILNAKLLFTNKLFKEFTLDNNQKLKVVETFDRAQTTREIKLVYSTLAEQFGDNGSIKRKSISESASSAVGSTKPSKEATKVISEENQVANRFKKLAGLIKG